MNSRSPHIRRTLPIAAGAAAVLFAGWYVAQKARLSTTPTGDPTISSFLAENAKLGFHNLSAFVLRDDEVRYGGLGSDETTEFEIGSITKTFNGELLDQAVTRHELTYKTTVGEILGERAADSELKTVTVDELVRHTSGLPTLPNMPLHSELAALKLQNPYAGITVDDLISQALSTPLKNRGEMAYSNLGHALLGQLVAIRAGLSYADLLQRDILTPLEMDDTYVAATGTVKPEAPRGKKWWGGYYEAWEMDGYQPAGAIRSTPIDLAKYARAIVDEQEPNAAWVQESDGSFWHNGGTFGFSSKLIVYPAERLAVFLVGDTPRFVDRLANQLAAAARSGDI
ncbi:serine hydrolase domain-containing protein [Corynebacterium lubricantis]|uniref:serine hydrolase domain-containing protein n=1 Tax=Corynebacterium lubricantis TaxID=541095 RepID=UPI00146157E4|nr:serine hydrolase domain-containing protein [Corynebacterium lubricantis]